MPKTPARSSSLNLSIVHIPLERLLSTPGGPHRETGAGGEPNTPEGQQRRSNDSHKRTWKGDNPNLYWAWLASPRPSPRTSQPPSPLPQWAKEAGAPSPSLPGSLRAEGASGTGSRDFSTLTSADSTTSAHIPAPPPSLRPPPGPLFWFPTPLLPPPPPSAPSTSASAPHRPCRKTDALLSRSLRPFLCSSPVAASSPRGACWEPGGGRGLAALQPRQAQSPPDKPLNRDLPGGRSRLFWQNPPV